jgi:hypothetical protein
MGGFIHTNSAYGWGRIFNLQPPYMGVLSGNAPIATVKRLG